MHVWDAQPVQKNGVHFVVSARKIIDKKNFFNDYLQVAEQDHVAMDPNRFHNIVRERDFSVTSTARPKNDGMYQTDFMRTYCTVDCLVGSGEATRDEWETDADRWTD